MRFFIALLVLIIMIATPILYGCSGSQTEDGDTTTLMAPDFQLQSLNGDEVKLSDLRGQPIMLNFWASWCYPCRLEMPLFQEIYEDAKWSQKGLVILAINFGESADDVQRFMTENGFSFTTLLDINGKVVGQYNISGYPTTFFIDKDGIIKGVKIGAFWDKAQIEQGLDLITE